MRSRPLHDALLTVLADGDARARLLTGAPSGHPITQTISDEEWALLSGLPMRRLIGLSRFLTRQYYRERVVRLFRYIRLLSPVTGRDPCVPLQSSAIRPLLDAAVLGSPATAAKFLAVIEPYLTEQDEDIQSQFPFWRDLIRYQSTLFRLEAEGNGNSSPAQHVPEAPRRAEACRILDSEWDVPALLQLLQKGEVTVLAASNQLRVRRIPTALLIACGRHHRITTIRCDTIIRNLVEGADGRRDRQALAQLAGLSRDQASQVLQKLHDVGALA